MASHALTAFLRLTLLSTAVATDLVATQVVASDAPPSTSWIDWLLLSQSSSQPSAQSATNRPSSVPPSPGKLLVWGGLFGNTPIEVPGLANQIVNVAAANGFGAAVSASGDVHTFVHARGQIHVRPLPLRPAVQQVELRESANQLVLLDRAGTLHSSVFDRDAHFSPPQIMDGILRAHRFKLVRCGAHHCVAVTKAGRPITWGQSNTHGQLGASKDNSPNTSANSDVPQFIQLPLQAPVADVACGDKHTVFLDTEGNLYSVGNDKWAQLGVSAQPWLSTHQRSTDTVQRAALLNGIAGLQVACGAEHTVMLVRDGTIFSFGFNQWGQLGHHNYSSFAPPSPIANYAIRAAKVYAGGNHSCLITDKGDLMCIGANEQGQLGNGTLQSSMKWKKVRLGGKPLKPLYLYSSSYTVAAVVDKTFPNTE